MLMRLIIMTLFIMISSQVFAGTGYEVTVETDEETKSYMVIFGGGRLFEQHTGFDPDTKKFVYLRWARAEEPPKPVAKIWKHDTRFAAPHWATWYAGADREASAVTH